MKKIALLAAVGLIASYSAAWAGAKDKSSNTLVDINSAGIINNTTAKTKVKGKDCSLQIQAKDVTLSDGEIAICIAEADVNTGGVPIGGNSIILAGEAKAGKFKIKADLSEVQVAGQGCGDVEALSYNGNVKCYEDDPIYRSDSTGAGTWRDACASVPGLTSPAPGASTLKANPAVPVVIGLCQMFTVGDRIPVPASVEWGRQGQRTGVIP